MEPPAYTGRCFSKLAAAARGCSLVGGGDHLGTTWVLSEDVLIAARCAEPAMSWGSLTPEDSEDARECPDSHASRRGPPRSRGQPALPRALLGRLLHGGRRISGGARDRPTTRLAVQPHRRMRRLLRLRCPGASSWRPDARWIGPGPAVCAEQALAAGSTPVAWRLVCWGWRAFEAGSVRVRPSTYWQSSCWPWSPRARKPPAIASLEHVLKPARRACWDTRAGGYREPAGRPERRVPGSPSALSCAWPKA